MRAKLKRLHSPDVDLATYWPEDEKCFGFFVQAMVGPEDAEGEESFGMQVCTPEWLRAEHASDEIVFAKNMIIVFEYDLCRIEAAISRYCARCIGATWLDVAEQVARIGSWEFDNYQAYKPASSPDGTK